MACSDPQPRAHPTLSPKNPISWAHRLFGLQAVLLCLLHASHSLPTPCASIALISRIISRQQAPEPNYQHQDQHQSYPSLFALHLYPLPLQQHALYRDKAPGQSTATTATQDPPSATPTTPPSQ